MSNQTYPMLNNQFNLLNLCILENGLFEGDRSWVHNDVVSSFSRMYFILSGEAHLEISGNRHELLQGKVYLIPAGTVCNYVCTSYIRKFYLHFSLEFLPGADIFQGFPGFLCMDYSQELLNKILENAKKDALLGVLELKSVFLQLAVRFFRLGMNTLPYTDISVGFYRQREVISYVSSHLDSRLRVAQIAEAFRLPAYTLSRNFKTDTGTALKEYIGLMLLTKSKQLLLNSTLTIQEIADTLCFCDAYYFSRFFSKYEKIPPREYRQIHLAKHSP